MPSTPKEESTMKYLKNSLKNKKKAKAMHANVNLINPEAVMHVALRITLCEVVQDTYCNQSKYLTVLAILLGLIARILAISPSKIGQ